MSLPEDERHTITCPGCGRRLFALRTAHCNWCGAPITETDFQSIAVQSHRILDRPTTLPPQPTGFTSYGYGQNPFWRQNPFSLYRGPLKPWQQKLQTVSIILFTLFMLVKIGYLCYALWVMHHIVTSMPH